MKSKEFLREDEQENLRGIASRICAAYEIKYKEPFSWMKLLKQIENRPGSTGFAPQVNLWSKMNSAIKSGKMYDLSLDTLYVLAEVLDVSCDYLLGRCDIDYDVDKEYKHIAKTRYEVIESWRRKSVKYDVLVTKINKLSRYANSEEETEE